MPQLIVSGTITSYVSRFLREMNIFQGGGCCSMWLILSERYMEKNGQMWERSGVEQWHFAIQVGIAISRVFRVTRPDPPLLGRV